MNLNATVDVTCAQCDTVFAESSEGLDEAIVKCDGCERWLCADCLASMARERGVGESDANQIIDRYGASGFLERLEEGDGWLCPECLADRE